MIYTRCYYHLFFSSSSFIFDFFAVAGLTPSTCLTLLDQCDKAISMLTTGHSVHRSGNNLQKFVDAVKVGIACLYTSLILGETGNIYCVYSQPCS